MELGSAPLVDRDPVHRLRRGLAALAPALSVGALWSRPRGLDDLRHVDAIAVVLALASSVPLAWRRTLAIEVLGLVANGGRLRGEGPAAGQQVSWPSGRARPSR